MQPESAGAGNSMKRNLEYIDDVSDLLNDLVLEKDIESIKDGLARIVIYIRNRHTMRGTSTESIAGLETSVIHFLNGYSGDDFEEIYSILYELTRLTPKFQIFNIDITSLRDISHDFDAACRTNERFRAVASDIRLLVHQHLSDRVIVIIEKLEEFLRSDKRTTRIQGTPIIGATDEEKKELLESDVFLELLELKDRLKTAWTRKDMSSDKIGSQLEFADTLEGVLSRLPDKEIKTMPEYIVFMNIFRDSVAQWRESRWRNISVGLVRYHLKKLIEEVMNRKLPNKGETLFRLMTLDALMEQISFIYFSNIVNSRLREITGKNYFYALRILVNLALCTRAVGHGTKHLGRFAFLTDRLIEQMDERPDRAAHFPIIVDTMNSELENNFSYLQELYIRNLEGPERYTVLNKILNNIIREKTTHLLGNMINNLKVYHDTKERMRFNRILKIIDGDTEPDISTFTYRFGTDITGAREELLCPEFMGGKGFSQVSNSRIIQSHPDLEIEVPGGTGFSTLTWNWLRENPERMNDLRQENRRIIQDLEERTGKQFGNGKNPMLLMARSGAIISMPGILDTVSHIGINIEIADEWARTLNEPERAYQSLVSFILSYSKSVLGIETARVLEEAGFERHAEIIRGTPGDIRQNIRGLQDSVCAIMGMKDALPEDPFEQLNNSVIAVFRSYENEIVQKQARNYGIPEQFQTGCLVQECMPVLSSRDCSGVFFTRNPVTGKVATGPEEQIEFAQGFFGNLIADGSITPSAIDDFTVNFPEHFNRLRRFKYYDERIQRYPTDIEFAVRNEKTYIVQSRVLKQSPIAQIMNSYDFFTEGIYSPFKLIKRTAFGLNRKINETYLDRKELDNVPVIAMGKPVNGGAVRGRIIKDQKNISRFEAPLIFITESNVPPMVIMKEDRFAGYISKEGGITSHAALVAIGERKPCVTDVKWEQGEDRDEIVFGGTVLREGDMITLDANTGNIYQEEIPIIEVGVIDPGYNRVRESVINVMEGLMSDDS